MFCAKKKSCSCCFRSLHSDRLSSGLECGILVALKCYYYAVIFILSLFKTHGKSGPRNSGIFAGKVNSLWDTHGVRIPSRRTFPSYHILSSTPRYSTCSVFGRFQVGFAARTFGRVTVSEVGISVDCRGPFKYRSNTYKQATTAAFLIIPSLHS
jgi:hypothetical protein